jgi:FixJ family two-component response regulator
VSVATDPAGRLVIVLDDDLGVLKGIQRLLTARGLDSELFTSAQDFETRAQLHSALCAVLDINLSGESGIDVRRRLTVHGHRIPVIFITGNDSERIHRMAMEAGCVAYLVKPFSAESLMNAIEKASAVEALPAGLTEVTQQEKGISQPTTTKEAASDSDSVNLGAGNSAALQRYDLSRAASIC